MTAAAADDIMKLHDVLMPKHAESMGSAFVALERLVLPLDEVPPRRSPHV